MKREIKFYYGDKVEVRYIDVEEDDLMPYPAIQKLLAEQQTPLPIVAIDEMPLWGGGVSFPAIVAELNQRGIKYNQR